jgi:hypothetical protein
MQNSNRCMWSDEVASFGHLCTCCSKQFTCIQHPECMLQRESHVFLSIIIPTNIFMCHFYYSPFICLIFFLLYVEHLPHHPHAHHIITIPDWPHLFGYITTVLFLGLCISYILMCITFMKLLSNSLVVPCFYDAVLQLQLMSLKGNSNIEG